MVLHGPQPSCWSQGQGLRAEGGVASVGVGGRERSLSCGVVAGPGFADQGGWRLKAGGGLPGALDLQKLLGLCLTMQGPASQASSGTCPLLVGTICSPPVSSPLASLWLFGPSHSGPCSSLQVPCMFFLRASFWLCFFPRTLFPLCPFG